MKQLPDFIPRVTDPKYYDPGWSSGSDEDSDQEKNDFDEKP